MHLVYNRLSGRELPKRVPDELIVSLQPVRVRLCAPHRHRHCPRSTAHGPTRSCRPRLGRACQGYREPERAPREVFVPEQQRVLQAFAAMSAAGGDGGAPVASATASAAPKEDLFAQAPTASQLHHATRDRPTIRSACLPRTLPASAAR